METFDVLFKAFLDDARVIPYDESFKTAIKKPFETNLKENIENIYKNSPTEYFKLTSSKQIFRMYQLWFLAIIIIQFSSENSLEQYPSGKDLKKWILTRNDSNISYFLKGPLSNQLLKIDFIEHYRNIMNPQNTIKDISQYLELATLQALNTTTVESTNAYKSSNNSHSKLQNSSEAFLLNLFSKDSDIYVSEGLTKFDFSKADFKAIEGSDSKIPIRKIQTLFNKYSMISVKRFELEHNAFQIDIDTFNKVLIVFEGVFVNTRKNDSYGNLTIEGHFTFNPQKNVYEFHPKTEFLTFRYQESIVKNFIIYVYFPTIGNVNMATSLELFPTDFFNVDIFENNVNDIVKKIKLKDSVVIYDGKCFRESYENNDEIELSNKYFLADFLRRDTKRFQGGLIDNNYRIIYKAYEEWIEYIAPIITATIGITWIPSMNIYPYITLIIGYDFTVDDSFQVTYEKIPYNFIQFTYNGGYVIFNGKVIRENYKGFGEEGTYMIVYLTETYEIAPSKTDTIAIAKDNYIVTIITRVPSGFIVESSYSIFEGIDNNAIGDWVAYKLFGNMSSEGYQSNNLERFDLIGQLLMRSDLTDFYDCPTEIFTDRIFECSGIVLKDEFIECQKIRIIGNVLYTLHKDKGTVSKEFTLIDGDEVFVVPSFKIVEGNMFEEYRQYIKFFRYTEQGYVETDYGTSYIASLYFVTDDYSLLLGTVLNGPGIYLVKNQYGLYDLWTYQTTTIANDKVIYSYELTGRFKLIDLSKMYSYKVIMGTPTNILRTFPTPLPTNRYYDFISEFSKKFAKEDYANIRLLEESENGILKRNCLKQYVSEYGKYPLIKTESILCVNKEYSLKIDENVFKGMILKNGDYYTFTNKFSVKQSSKISLKITSDLFKATLSFT